MRIKIGSGCALAALLAFGGMPGEIKGREERPKTVSLDARFYTELYRKSPVMRDVYFEERLNAIVQARGIVVSLGDNNRYKRKYRIVLADRDAERLKMKITYHLYAERRDTISMLAEKELLEFSGRLVAYTPVTTRRDAYILDVVLGKGAMLIE